MKHYVPKSKADACPSLILKPQLFWPMFNPSDLPLRFSSKGI